MKHLVTERALVARLRRKLARDDRFLTVERPGSRREAECGRYTIWKDNALQDGGGSDTLVRWARELGVMHSDEELAAATRSAA